MLDRVEARRVDRDEARVGAERRPRAGGEILQPRADGEDHVGLAASALAEVEPMMPIGPACAGW